MRGSVRGPTLLEPQDQVLRKKLNHFDHERIPAERVVRARHGDG